MVMWFDWVNVNSGLQLIYEIQYTHDSGLIAALLNNSLNAEVTRSGQNDLEQNGNRK